MINKKKIIALVPARGGSKGIKLKNLKKINGKTLIHRTSDFIDECNFFDLKIISSDNKKIIKHALKLNFKIIKRSKKLSGDKISDFQVIKEAISFIENKIKNRFDYLVYLQPTSPIREREHLYNTIKKLIKLKFDGAWSVTKVDTKYHPLKLLKIEDNKLKLINKKGIKIVARQMLKPVYMRNGAFYIFNIKKLMKNQSIYLKKILPAITDYEIANIDNMNDLNAAKKLLIN